MRSALLATWTLLLGMLLLMIGVGLQGTLTGLRATIEGFPVFVAGIVLSSYYAGFVGGSIIAPRMVSAVGHIRVFSALCSVASVLILLQGVFVGPWIWILLRVVSGFCFAAIYVVAESWLNERVGNEYRGLLLALYMVICFAGLGLGQLLLNVADPRGNVLFILVSLLISLALVPMALTATPAPDFSVPQRVGLGDLMRWSPLAVAGVAMSGVVSGCLFALGAVYLAGHGLGTRDVSLFMATAILAACFSQLPMGRLSDRMDRRQVVSIACLVAAVAAVAAWWAGEHSPALFLALFAVYGSMSQTLYSLNVAHANDQVPSDQMVGASSTLILVNGVGSCAGPILVAGLMDRLGNEAYLPALAAFHLLLAGYALYRMGRRGPMPAAQKTPYVGVPPGTNSSGELLGHAGETGLITEKGPDGTLLHR